MRTLVILVAPLAVAFAAIGDRPLAAAAGQRPSPSVPRDPVVARAGTGEIAGLVTAAESGAPLRQVEITLSSPVLKARRVARSGATGQFRFTDLPAGRYAVHASRPGFVPLRYGAADPLEPGQPVDLADGATISTVNFKLPRAAVISGQVIDEVGEPVLDAEVRAMRYQTRAGQRRLTPASRVRVTDDLGAFRIFGLLPGTYYISAVPRWREASSDPDTEAKSGHVPTYYPGTVDLAAARAVTVPLGGEVSGISFAIVAVSTARLRGTVVDSTGTLAAGAQITAVRREAGNAFVTAADTRARADGTFELVNLPPGSYSVQAWLRGTADAAPEFGATIAHAAGTDLDNVVVRTDAGGTLRGRVVVRGDNRRTVFKPSLIEITARPASPDVRLPAGAASAVRVRDDWSFELRGLSGRRVVRVSGVPAPWALESITLGSDDVTDGSIELAAGRVTSGLEIVLTTRATEIDGTVDRPASDRSPASVVIFSADSAHWQPNDRRVQIRRAAFDGGFRIRGLPPGDYLAIAVPYIWQGEWSDPDFLNRASAAATRVRLAPEERKTLRLTVTPIPQ